MHCRELWSSQALGASSEAWSDIQLEIVRLLMVLSVETLVSEVSEVTT